MFLSTFRKSVLLTCLLLLLYAGNILSVAAQEEAADLELTVEAGYEGYYKNGAWLPLTIEAANEGPSIEGYLQVVTGNSPDTRVVYRTPIALPTRSNKRVTTYIYLSSFTDRVTVTLLDESGEAVAGEESGPLTRLDAEALLYGVVSDEAVDMGFLDNVNGDRPDAAVAFVELVDLPEAGAAWNALDVLILTGVDTGRLTGGQLAALRGWISTGGQLIVAGGPGWQETTAAVSDLLPVTVSGSRALEALPSLEEATGVPPAGAGPYIVATSSLRSGTLLVYEEELPLLARQQIGAGAVYFLALDPALAPLQGWPGNESFWSQVALRAPRTPAWAHGPQNSYSAGQALTSLSSLRLPSGLWLFIFLAIYVVAIGPANYLLLRRLRRRELAWITIPLIIFGFTVLAYLTGFSLRGNTIILNQMSVAYGHVEGEEVRVNSLFGLYSPRRATYDVALPANVLIHPFERNFGNMAGGGNLAAISRGNNVTLDEVRVDVSGVETFVVDSYRPAPALSGRVQMSLEGNATELEITVQNNGEFLFEEAGVLVGNAFVPLGDLAPGASETTIERLSSSQTASPTGPGMFGGPFNSPLRPHYAQILGTSDYMNDPEIFPRYQLLESLGDVYGPTGSQGSASAEKVTLVGWSEERQFDAELVDADGVTTMSTTLYFLELPLEQVTAGQEVLVPPEMLDWRVLAGSSYRVPGITNFFLEPGWLELAFEPWPLFSALEVSVMEVVLRRPAESQDMAPELLLWDWSEESWRQVGDFTWGRRTIADFEPYLGPGNEVRIRLANDQGTAIQIQELFPLLTGSLR